MGFNEETGDSFEKALAEHIATAPPRHFGQSIAGRFTGTKRTCQQGIFAVRILVEGTDGKFWINGLLTKIEIRSKSIKLVYYDQIGQQFIDIDLEHLAEMQVFKPRDGTYFAIEEERLVLKKETTNHHPEGGSHVLTSPRSPKPLYGEAIQSSF